MRNRLHIAFPSFAKLKVWVDTQSILPSDNFTKAVDYLKRDWPRLIHFSDAPRVWLDNPPSSGRRSEGLRWARTKGGTEVVVMIYTILETAKPRDVKPWE